MIRDLLKSNKIDMISNILKIKVDFVCIGGGGVSDSSEEDVCHMRLSSNYTTVKCHI